MNDDRSTMKCETAVTDGIALAISTAGQSIETERYLWPAWNTAPAAEEREKASLQLFSKAVQSLPSFI